MKRISLYIVFFCFSFGASAQLRLLAPKGEIVILDGYNGLFDPANNNDTTRVSNYFIGQNQTVNTLGRSITTTGSYGSSVITDSYTTQNNFGRRLIESKQGGLNTYLDVGYKGFPSVLPTSILGATNGVSTSQVYVQPNNLYLSTTNGTNTLQWQLLATTGRIGYINASTSGSIANKFLGVVGQTGNTAELDLVDLPDGSNSNELITSFQLNGATLSLVEAGITRQVTIPTANDIFVGQVNGLSNISSIQFSGTGVSVASGGSNIANVTITGGGGAGSVPIVNNTLVTNDQFTHNNGAGLVTTFNFAPYRQRIDTAILAGNNLQLSLLGDNTTRSLINLSQFAQTLSYNTSNRQVSLSNVNGVGGGSFTIPNDNTDAQALSFNTSTNQLSITGGNSVSLSSLNNPDVAIAAVSSNNTTVGSTVSNINFSNDFLVTNNSGGKVTVDISGSIGSDGNGVYDSDNNGEIWNINEIITSSIAPTNWNMSNNVNWILSNQTYRVYDFNAIGPSNLKSDIQIGGGTTNLFHFYNSDYTFLSQQQPFGDVAIKLGIKRNGIAERFIGWNNNNKLIVQTDATIAGTPQLGWNLVFTGRDLDGFPIVDFAAPTNGPSGADGNNFINDASFATNSGVLSLIGNGGGAGATVDLDGRYLQSLQLEGNRGNIGNDGTAVSPTFNVKTFVNDITGTGNNFEIPTRNQRFGWNSNTDELYVYENGWVKVNKTDIFSTTSSISLTAAGTSIRTITGTLNDNGVTTSKIANDAVTLDKLDGDASFANQIIGYDASGNPTNLGAGTGITIANGLISAAAGGSADTDISSVVFDGVTGRLEVTEDGNTLSDVILSQDALNAISIGSDGGMYKEYVELEWRRKTSRPNSPETGYQLKEGGLTVVIKNFVDLFDDQGGFGTVTGPPYLHYRPDGVTPGAIDADPFIAVDDVDGDMWVWRNKLGNWAHIATIQTVANDDNDAGNKGVKINQFYTLSATNTYSLPAGLVKQKVQ